MQTLPDDIITEILLNLKPCHLYDACIAIPAVEQIIFGTRNYDRIITSNPENNQDSRMDNIQLDHRIYQLGPVTSYRVTQDNDRDDRYYAIEMNPDYLANH